MQIARSGPETDIPSHLPTRIVTWAGASIVPITLLPLAGVLVWVAIWQVWLPRPGGGAAVTRAVTTVDANASLRPTHKVTTVVRTTSGGAPSRRSETIALALLFLGAGVAVVAVFDRRITAFELDRDGLKVTLTPAEKTGAARLVEELAGGGAGPERLGRGLRRYLDAVAAARPAGGESGAVRGAAEAKGLTVDQAEALAIRIAADAR